MDNATHIFFIISSVGFVLLWILVAILVIYLIRIAHSFHRMTRKLEEGMQSLSDNAQTLLDDVQESIFYTFLFGRKKKKRSHRAE